MNISGAGSLFDVAGDLSIGAGGIGTNGTLNLSDGGTIANGDQGFIGRFSGSNGTVSVGDALYLKDRGVINLDGGELAADDFVFQDSARDLNPTVNFNSGTLCYTANKVFSNGCESGKRNRVSAGQARPC